MAFVSGKILVVDDNNAMRHAVSRLMTHAGYEVIECDCGEGCIEQARKHHPDLVLLDVQLPDIDGMEVLRRIKGDPELKDIFVVHLSAEKTDANSTTVGLESGADGYIAQPVENRELVARVRAYLRHKRTMDDLRNSEARYRQLFESNPQPMWVFDQKTRRFLAVNDSAVKHYGYSRAHFLTMKVDDLVIADTEPLSLKVTAFNLHQRHRKQNGELIDVEISEHTMMFGGAEATAALITDVTQWKQVEKAREQLIERYEREFASIEKLGSSRAQVGEGVSKLDSRDNKSQAFSELNARYENLVGLALDQRIYKVDHSVSAGLRSVAEQLFNLRATPRDVIELHYQALKNLVPQPELPQAQGFLEVGRLTIVELMGYLAAVYLEHFLGKQLPKQ